MTVLICCVFFFKQKTAYEMRISDWSSDVCSSDLLQVQTARITGLAEQRMRRRGLAGQRRTAADGGIAEASCAAAGGGITAATELVERLQVDLDVAAALPADPGLGQGRSGCRQQVDRKSTRLTSSHQCASRMQSSA